MSGITIIACSAAALAWLAWSLLVIRRAKEIEDAIESGDSFEISRWRSAAEELEVERNAYQRALGLPYWDQIAVENDLWVRAANGDEIARDVIEAAVDRQRSTIKTLRSGDLIKARGGIKTQSTR